MADSTILNRLAVSPFQNTFCGRATPGAKVRSDRIHAVQLLPHPLEPNQTSHANLKQLRNRLPVIEQLMRAILAIEDALLGVQADGVVNGGRDVGRAVRLRYWVGRLFVALPDDLADTDAGAGEEN